MLRNPLLRIHSAIQAFSLDKCETNIPFLANDCVIIRFINLLFFRKQCRSFIIKIGCGLGCCSRNRIFIYLHHRPTRDKFKSKKINLNALGCRTITSNISFIINGHIRLEGASLLDYQYRRYYTRNVITKIKILFQKPFL